MRKTVFLIAIVVTAGNAFSEESEQVERTKLETYVWLEREGIFDEAVPNSEIHDLIVKGLQDEDKEIEQCTVTAMSLFCGLATHAIESGGTPKFDRRFQDIPDLYDTLMEMWDKGWEAADGVMPEPTLPDDLEERFEERTGFMGYSPPWTMLPLMMAYLFPGDDKVYEIIWEVNPIPEGGYQGGFPDGGHNDKNNPIPLLSALFVGKFNNKKDQDFRIDLLLNKETIFFVSSLAARSLGEFRSDEGLAALATVLTRGGMKYGTPNITIVEAMLKYEEEAIQFISLMQNALDTAKPLNTT